MWTKKAKERELSQFNPYNVSNVFHDGKLTVDVCFQTINLLFSRCELSTFNAKAVLSLAKFKSKPFFTYIKLPFKSFQNETR